MRTDSEHTILINNKFTYQQVELSLRLVGNCFRCCWRKNFENFVTIYPPLTPTAPFVPCNGGIKLVTSHYKLNIQSLNDFAWIFLCSMHQLFSATICWGKHMCDEKFVLRFATLVGGRDVALKIFTVSVEKTLSKFWTYSWDVSPQAVAVMCEENKLGFYVAYVVETCIDFSFCAFQANF